MKSDIEIAQEAKPLPITEIAAKLGLPADDVTQYGKYKAKIKHNSTFFQNRKPDAKMILVTAISPTPAGEGKTTTTVGLGDALTQLGKKTVICIREPSLGPVFGVKGGAAGGGYAQVIPMEDINLHFTGDLHAITTANNLLAAMIDNHIWHGNALRLDPRQIIWRRAIDMNDRQLRFVVNGLNNKANGVPREDSFDITAASEVMAVFCLSKSLKDLKENLARIVVGYTYDGGTVTAGDINAQGAMTAVLKDAFEPNLVQTLEHTPALIHGGPFANIAHGCNSVAATLTALKLGDYVVTEAGFGADLGAEKFINIKCRRFGLQPAAAVLVVSVRALKHHGGKTGSLEDGIPNMKRHIDNIVNKYGLPCVVAINRFPGDTDEEIGYVINVAKEMGAEVAESNVFMHGGKGGKDLAEKVLKATEAPNNFKHVYELDQSLTSKIETIASEIYRAIGVKFSDEATSQIKKLEKLGYGNLPVCIAKTQYSFSDNAKKLSAPTDFWIFIRQMRLSAGAGFVVALLGDIMTTPGLPKVPSAEMIDVDENGNIKGLF